MAVEAAAAPAPVGTTAPSFRVVEAHGNGYFDEGSARAVFEAHESEVAGCLERAHAAGAVASGTATFSAYFRSDGSLFRTSVPAAYNQLGAPMLETCIDNAMQAWNYPPPPPEDTHLGRVSFRLHFGDGEPLPPELAE